MGEQQIKIGLAFSKTALARMEHAPETIEKAAKLSLSTATRRANAQLSRRLGKTLAISSRIIKGRLRVSIRNGSGLVFVGLNPLNAGRLSPKEAPGGVIVSGGRFLPDAFIIGGDGPMKGLVFRRTTQARFPMEKEYVDIEGEALPIVAEIAEEINTFMQQEFDRQLKRL